MLDNIITMTDSYKVGHYLQYPPGTTNIYSYFESRGVDKDFYGGDVKEIVFFGLQYFLKRYLNKPITQENINKAGALFKAHFGHDQFYNRAGWEYILKKYRGYLPVEIKAVPEGMVLSPKNVMMTIENTDPKCYWLTNYLETILVQVWYTCTVCTNSRVMKQMIYDALVESGDPALLPFKLHDFGYRGVTCPEQAAVGGAAHLVNFQGTDTVAAVELALEYYNCAMAGFSIPASEHSTITSWGQDGEVDAFENMLKAYPTGPVACVSDSFNIYDACRNKWGSKLKNQVINRDGFLVVRPDSGDATKVVPDILSILGERFGFNTNAKGYKVLPAQVRVIQGDGISGKTLVGILEAVMDAGWSIDNVAFGSGGGLLQMLNRDTLKFAFKACSGVVNGVQRDIFKSPVGCDWKKSKKGRLKLIQDFAWKNDRDTFRYKTVSENSSGMDLLRVVYRNGEVIVDQSFDEVRQLAELDDIKFCTDAVE
jgi:nicotinamide phosphoribosyltransferase